MTHSDRQSTPLPGDFQQQVKGILGLGTSPLDGERRISKGPFYKLFQGNEAAHDAMLKLCVALQRELERRGLSIEDLTQAELIEVMEGLGGMKDEG